MRDRERDDRMMMVALCEARRARPSPNPPVGAVVARGDRIVSVGHHVAPGRAHAEVVALRRAGKRATGATLYITLAPCNHHGRTPPCTEAVLSSGVREVVYGVDDPNPKANRGAGARLRRAGIAVRRIRGARWPKMLGELIEGFECAVVRARPCVILKLATTLDGRIATRAGDARWITGVAARRHARRLRASSDAVLVGVGTVLADDPRLDVRKRGAREPARIVLDSRLRTPRDARMLRTTGGEVILAHVGAPGERGRRLEAAGAVLVRCRSSRGRVDLRDLLRRLLDRGILRVLVEGGSEVAGAFVDADLVDRVVFYLSPRMVGGRQALAAVGGRGRDRLADALELEGVTIERVGGGSDWVLEGKKRR